jgi:hypothetical protein
VSHAVPAGNREVTVAFNFISGRTVVGPKRDQDRKERRKLHKEELHNLDYSININRVIKSGWITQMAMLYARGKLQM